MIESKRMTLKKFTAQDFDALQPILGNPEVMYAWEHGFSDEEITNWINKNLKRYADDGCGYLHAVDKETGKTVGAIGLIYNRDMDGRAGWELGYILSKDFWGRGYAKEGARACIDYALSEWNADAVYCEMRTNNESSRCVAEALGMKSLGAYDREYCGQVMPHYLYVQEKHDK